MSSHEPIAPHRRTAGGSDRNFGLVLAGFFVIVGLGPLLHGTAVRWWAVGIALLLLLLALAAPQRLSPLNHLWFRLGVALGRVVSPLVMAVVYYAVVVPIGLIMWARGKDPLRLRREPQAATYWIRREPPGPPRGSMSRQF